MLSRLVLPAPFGPITDMISPVGTSRLTCDTACTPPNDLETSRISSSALMTATACGGAQTPSGSSRQPPLATAVVLHVAIALALSDAGQSQIELLDVLVLADRLRIPVQHDAAGLHHGAMLG